MVDGIKVGVIYPQVELGGDPDAVRRIGTAAEELGYDHLVAYDHVLGADHADREPALGGLYTEEDPFHEPLVMFSHLAALTSRIEFVTGILILPQRQTVLVAKQAADVDVLSGGRLRLGVGVGWNHVEYEALGQDFASRGRRSAEQIELLRRLWSEPLVTFAGEFDRVERAGILPRPTRSIPIWLGGGHAATFARAARLADGFIFTGTFDDCAANFARLKAALAEAGRPMDGFGVQLSVRAGEPERMVADIHAWRELGGTHAAVSTMRVGLDSVEAHLDLIGELRSRIDRG